MKKGNRKGKIYRTQYITAAAVCLISAVSLFAVYENEKAASQSEEYIADLTALEEEQLAKSGKGKEAATSQAKAEHFENEDMFGWDNVMDATDEVKLVEEAKEEETSKNQKKQESEKQEDQEDHASEEDLVITADAITKPVQLNFDDNADMLWPVNGNVVLNYSMDKSVYFPTLEQYRYHPAIVIEAAEGTPVQAAARGQVIHIEEAKETGMTLIMDLGDDYRVTYGQLKDVCVNAGQVVESGEIIGYVAAPTKYYSVEGPNLYMQMARGNQTTNPMEYLGAANPLQ